MNACPSCGAAKPARIDYPEGSVWICSLCGLQWGKVALGPEGYVPTANDYYLDPASLGDPSTYPPYVDFFATAQRLLGKRPLKILDVGCGSGAFLGECLRRGHDARGVEANTRMRAHMPPEIAQRCHFGLAQEIAGLDQRFDMITFFDSFEHIESSFEILAALKNSLAPGGLFYLRVNNNRDIYNFAAKALLRVFPPLGRRLFKTCFTFPAHCWNFSEQAMRNLLATHGFQVLSFTVGETPASRLTRNPLFAFLIRCAYLANAAIGGGKIGNYYVTPCE